MQIIYTHVPKEPTGRSVILLALKLFSINACWLITIFAAINNLNKGCFLTGFPNEKNEQIKFQPASCRLKPIK
jgi:hypothetical protein